MARAGAGGGLLPLPAEVPAGSRKPMTVTMGQQSGIRPVITSKDGRGSYVLLRVLVSDKNHTTILLGAPAFADPRRAGALLVHPTERVIVKAVQLSWLSDDRAERPLEELAVLWHLREDPSPHIVQLVDHMQDGSHLYIILRYHGGGDLFERVSLCSRGLPPTEACRYFMHMAEGLRHLKRHGIAHGDLSLENAVLWSPGDTRGRNSGGSSGGSGSAGEETDGDGVVSGAGGGDVVVGGDGEGVALIGAGCTLIDLGMCRVLPEGETMCTDMRPRGKPSYISPEVLSGTHVPVDPFAADVWSLGICLYAMLTGRPLYADPEDPAFMLLAKGRAEELLRHYHGFGLVLDELAHDLVCAMLRPRAEDRPTVEEVMSHPWIRAHSDRAVEGGSGVGVGPEEGGVVNEGGSSSVTTNPATDDDDEDGEEEEETTMEEEEEDDDDDDDADEMDTVMFEEVRTPAVVHVGRPPLPPDVSGGGGRRSGGGGRDGGGGISAVVPTGRTLSIFSAGLFVGRGESRALSETGSSVCTDDGGSESEAACQLATEPATPTHHDDGVDMHLDARGADSSASSRRTGERSSPLPTAKPPSAVEHSAGVDVTLSLPPPSSPSSLSGADTHAHTPSSSSPSPSPPSSSSRSSSSARETSSIGSSSNSGGDCATSMIASTALIDAAHAHIPHL